MSLSCLRVISLLNCLFREVTARSQAYIQLPIVLASALEFSLRDSANAREGG